MNTTLPHYEIVDIAPMFLMETPLTLIEWQDMVCWSNTPERGQPGYQELKTL